MGEHLTGRLVCKNAVLIVGDSFNLRVTGIRLQSHDLLFECLVYENLAGALDGTVGYSPIGLYGPIRVDLGMDMGGMLDLMKTING